MEKVINLLERHVHWLAILAGLAFVGYMGYSYLYTPPLSVKIGMGAGTPTLPGTVDQEIVKGPVTKLNDEMKPGKVEKPSVVNVLDIFKKRIAETDLDLRPIELAVASPHAPFAPGGEQAIPQGPDNGPVTKLPGPLPIPVLAGSSMRWTVLAANPSDDVAYWSGKYTVDEAELVRLRGLAYNNKNIPPNALKTEFVQVTLFRQEQLPDGKWSQPVIIDPVNSKDIKPYPGEQAKGSAGAPKALGNAPKVPADKTTAEGVKPVKQDWYNFHHWVETSQKPITAPPFPQTAGKGVPGWVAPTAAPTVLAPGVPAPPRAFNAQPAAAPAPAPGGAANPPPSNNEILVHDVTVKEGKTYRYAVRYRLYNSVFDIGGVASPKIAETFDVTSPDPSDPKLSEADKTKLWSPPFSVEPSAYIFVTHISLFKSEAQFALFVLKGGHWQPLTAKGTPGDPLNANGKSATQWTLVDVRKDPRSGDIYVIVMDDHGVLQQRDEKSDAVNPDLQRLKQLAGAGAPAGVAGAVR